MNKKKIKKYRVSADDSMGMAMSVVKNAAVESDFVYFSEQKMEKFVGVEGERRMIYGCALRPDFPIYRNNGEEEYYLEFDKEAIDKISKNYFKMGFQSSWTEGHENEVEGLTITESWIKESMTLDKSIALGLDANLPIGTWFIGCYCENDEIWNAVKENKYAGFSIEALISVEEFESQINKSKDNNDIMTNEQEMNLFEKFKKWLTSAKEEVLEANPQVKEKVAEAIRNDELPISAATDPMNFEEQPTVEPTEPQNEPSEPSEPTVEPTQTVEPEPTVEPTQTEPKVEEPKEDNSQLVELINSLKAEIEALKESNSGLTEKIKEMGKRPSAQPVNTNAKNVGGGGDNYASWREQMRNMIR